MHCRKKRGKLASGGEMALCDTFDLHMQNRVAVVLVVGGKKKHLLDQTEVIDELSLSLSQLINHLQENLNMLKTPNVDANTRAI